MNSIKLKNKINLLTLQTLLIFLHPVMYAQFEVQEDKTLSPYFYIPDGESETEKLPLKSTRADVNIAGVIADVVITQNYKNEGSQPIEAIYVFPGSTRAAVYAMKMTIGERTIKAKIEEKNKARQDYEEARQNGQTASLLEQQRPNVFQMNVANIMPGDNIIVELKYTELLVPDEGVYAFVYPTVVGPRYSNTPESIASTNDRWIANPYTTEGKLPFYDFDLQVNLNAGLPVQDVACNTHETDIQFLDPTKVQIDLKPTESKGGNRDFILQYRLQGKQIESGLMLYEGKDENFFLLMMQPPKQVKSENIPPREYIFIVDVSGSMHGFPLDVSKTLLRDLIGNLRPYDKFNVMLFAGGSQLFAERSVDANSSNISRAISFIDKQRGGGGTELLPALKRALKLDGTEDFSRSFVIVTDGYVTVEKQAYELIRQNLGKANFFTFGIGSSVNRYILEGMAHVGNGTSFIATEKNEATAMADKFRKYASNPVLTNIEVNFKGLDVYDVEPLSVPDVFSERPVLVYGKYRGNPNGSVSLSGKTGNKRYNWGMDINEANPDKANVALRYLWAREKIRLAADYADIAMNDQLVSEITELGLKYNLLTAYTSFIAIDSEIRNAGGTQTTVQQPLPLPQGVSNNAVGSSVSQYKLGRSSGQPGNNNIYIDGLQSVSPMIVEEDIAEEVVFTVVESSPKYIHGEKALNEFIKNNFNIPQDVKDAGISGTIYVSFVVKADGTIEEIRIERGLHPSLDLEAMRVIGLTSGNWLPGKQRKTPVDSRIVIPIKI